jgi:dipeptidyl aminopeptidase/acylaminoacyl peptidase
MINKKKFKSVITTVALIGLVSICYAVGAERPALIRTSKISLQKKLLYLKNGDIWYMDISSRIPEKVTSKQNITNYCVSNDLTKIIYVKNFKKLYELDLTTWKDKYLTDLETDMSNPSISPANDKVVYVSHSLKEFYTSSFNKAYKETVRHLWLLDLKSLKKGDLTEDSPKQYSAPQWSPDGRRISFASSAWNVYIRNMTSSDNDLIKVGDGYYSEWVDDKTLAVGSSKSVNFYNTEKIEKTSEIKIQPAFSPAKFSLGIANDLYYEDQTENVNLDIIYINTVTGQKGKVAEDARNPIYVK